MSYFSRQVNPLYVEFYKIDDKGDGHCNLVILNATTDHTGEYQCQETTDFDQVWAQLSVRGCFQLFTLLRVNNYHYVK